MLLEMVASCWIAATGVGVTVRIGVTVGVGVGVTVALLSSTVNVAMSTTGGASGTWLAVASTSQRRWVPFVTVWKVIVGLAGGTTLGSPSGIGPPLARIGAGSRSRKTWAWTSSGRRA